MKYAFEFHSLIAQDYNEAYFYEKTSPKKIPPKVIFGVSL